MAHVRIYVTALLVLACWPQVINRTRDAPHLYRRYCISCHGHDGRAQTSKGKFSHARNFADPQWHDEVSDERIFNSIMNGRNVRGNMPAFAGKLKEREVNSLVVYVRQFKAAQQ